MGTELYLWAIVTYLNDEHSKLNTLFPNKNLTSCNILSTFWISPRAGISQASIAPHNFHSNLSTDLLSELLLTYSYGKS